MSTRLLTTCSSHDTAQHQTTRCVESRQIASARVNLRGIESRRVKLCRRKGFTVLEVLVAMFILLVGGLAIMNIFPPALQVIRGSENREIALSMTQSVLERYNNNPATIPDATYHDDGVGNWGDPPNVAVVGSRTRNFALPVDTTTAAFDASALNGFKRIVGERQKVLREDTANETFVLLNHSYSGTPQVWREDIIDNVTVTNLGVLDFQNATRRSTGADFFEDVAVTGAPTTSLRNPPSNRRGSDGVIYYVSYRWLDSTTGRVNGVTDEPLYYTSGAVPQLVLQTRPVLDSYNLNDRILPGLINVRIRELLAPDAAPITADNANLGYLVLNNTQVVAGDVVSVDYTVSDWRYLVNESNANTATTKDATVLGATPTDNVRDVRLPLAFLANPDPTPPANFSLKVLLYSAPTTDSRLTSNSRRGEWTGTLGVIGTSVVIQNDPSSVTYDVSRGPGYPSGTSLNPAATSTDAMPIPIARTVFRASNSWTQQVSVAAKSYVPFHRYVGALPRPASEMEAWREYWWNANSSTIYFHPSEAGKTVLVTFEYNNGTNYKIVSDQVVPISSRIIARPASVPLTFSLPLPAGSGQVVEGVLLDNNGSPIPATSILSVRGASIQARTAWIEGGNFVQQFKEDYRPLTQ